MFAAFLIFGSALAGKCTDSQDLALATKLTTDIPDCMEKSQTEAGIASCIEAKGFTAGCSGCVGTYGKCVLDKCISDCEADPTGSACKTCYTTKCEPAFDSCTGFPPSLSEPEVGKCNSKDLSLASGLASDIPACMEKSQTAAGIAACIEKDGFSAPCAGCVGTYGVCVIDKCLSDCSTDPTGSACKTCYSTKCEPAFDACTGFPPALEAIEAGKCTDSQDLSLASGLESDIPACLEKSQTEAGIAACIEAKGFTAGCSACVGTYGTCVIDKCLSDCSTDPTGSACKTCYTSKCEPAFLTCSGFPSPSKLKAIEAGKCTDSQDLALAEGLEKDIPACMEQSQTDAGIASCIEAKGFTAGCSACVGTYGACVLDKCLSDCSADPTGSGCKTCYTSKCEPAFLTCSGFPSPSLKATQLEAAPWCVWVPAPAKQYVPECADATLGASLEAAPWCVWVPAPAKQYVPECADATLGASLEAAPWCVWVPAPAKQYVPECAATLTAIEAGKCTDSKDLSLAEGLEKDIPACMQESQTESGIAACIEAKGFTAGCSGCVGTYGKCVLDKCLSDCSDPTGESCKTCYTTKCMPAFLTCTGFPKPAELATPPSALVLRMLRAE